MANTSNILAAFAIAFLASSSLSSAFAKHNSDIPNALEKHLDHELQPFLRETRQKEAEVFHLKNSNNPLELEEELSEPKSVYAEKRAIEVEAKDNGRSEEPIIEEEEERDAQDDTFSYRNMHDFIQALILADEEDITERLQQLRENATKSEEMSNLPKRHAVASAAAAASSGLLGANLWDAVPLVDLDAHSCEVEAFSHGHLHVSGTITHEFFCELRKSWHYGLIVMRNLRSGLTLGPLVAGDAIAGNIFDRFFHHTSHLLHVIVREPRHLLILPDIIRDAIPCPSIIGAIHRIRHVFFRVVHFGLDLFRGHVRHVLAHLFSHRFHHLRRYGWIAPVEEIVAEPVVSTGAASAAAAATATATATATAAASSVVPDYQTSLAEVLASCRGFRDGYWASGVPHLIRVGTSGLSLSSVLSTIGSYRSRIPYLGYGPVGQSTTVTSSASSASSSVGIGSVVSPVVEPAVIPAVIGTETASSSAASATATATATVAETEPVFSAGPCESISPVAATSASATATAAASPVVSSYPTASLTVVPTASDSSVATATASAAASSSANVVSTPAVAPITLPFRRYVRPVAPATASAAAAASASASTAGPAGYRGLDLDIDRRIRYPPIRSRVYPAVIPSSAGTSSAAASASASASASSSSAAAASSSGAGFNFALPREQIVGALGYDYLLPGDIITVALRNKSILYGRILDATSPVTFSFLRPRMRTSLFRHGGRVWNLLPRDFRDPECFRRFNDPLLLRYSL